MSAYKKLNKQDAYISTYTARKTWIASGSNFNDYGILNLIGLSGSGAYIPNSYNVLPGGGPINGVSTSYDRRLVFESVHHLYYSLFENGVIPYSSSYENYLQSSFDVTGSRNLEERVAVFTLSKEVYGTHIEPFSVAIIPDFPNGEYLDNYVLNNYVTSGGIASALNEDNKYTENTSNLYGATFPLQDLDYIEEESDYVLETPAAGGQYLDTIFEDQHTTMILDDGEGRLYFRYSDPRVYVGNVIYTHGQIIITEEVVAAYFNHYFNPLITWQSNLPIYTHNYHCRIKSGELNHTLNKTALNSSTGQIADNISGSVFQPYFTTVGLYNDANELVAVAKMSQPVPKSADTDMVVVVRLDMNFGVNRFTQLDNPVTI